MHCIPYNFRTNKIIGRKRHRGLDEPGARSLFVDHDQGRLYVLVNYGKSPYIFVICCRCNEIINRIEIPVDNINPDGSWVTQSSHDRKAIAKDFSNNHLLVIEDEKLFDVDTLRDTAKRIKSNKKFQYIVSNPLSKITYLITNEYDEDSENPYFNNLCIMQKK